MGRDKNETFEVYVTKYLFTKGIQKRRVWADGDDSGRLDDADDGWFRYFGEGKEWHKTWDSAVKRAEEMKAKKIKSLERQIAKVRSMAFNQSA